MTGIRTNGLITHQRLLEIIDYDRATGFFTNRVPRKGARRHGILGHVESNGYRRLKVDDGRFLAHRLAWFYVYGEWPTIDIDHKNRMRDDNRIENLREATVAQNHQNLIVSGSISGLKGAHWNRFRGYWQSYIRVNGKSKRLGRFETAEAAHAAYVAAAHKYFGEFARVK